MPNHVTNRLTIHAEGKRLEEILDAIKSDEAGRGSIDFNKLIPMPESLNIESGTTTDRAIEIYLTALNPQMPSISGVQKIKADIFSNLVKGLNSAKPYQTYRTDLSKEDIKNSTRYNALANQISLGRTAVNNYLMHGSIDWYDWAVKNWGTKWNAYGFDDFEIDPKGNTLSFLTAWDSVPEVLTVLSERFPDVNLSYKYADEDIGCNVGEMTFQNGDVIEEYIPQNQSKEAYELAFEVMESSASDYDLVFNEESQEYEYHEDMECEMQL